MSNISVLPSDLWIGPHYSKQNGSFLQTVNSVCECETITAFQLFIQGRNGYCLNPKFDIDDLLLTSKKLQTYHIKMVIHAAYFYNLAGAADGIDTDKAKQSIEKTRTGIINELDIAVMLGNEDYVPPVVIHTGSCIDKKQRIKEVVRNINYILESDGMFTQLVATHKTISVKEVKRRRVMCLENAAGEGNKIGSTISELSEIYNHPDLETKNNLCFCIDTAHLFGEGTYDFGKVKSIREFVEDWKKVIPLSTIKVLHYNDSKVPLGAKKDRHELIGCGYMLDHENIESLCAIKEVIKLLRNELYGCAVIFESPRPSESAQLLMYRLASD